MKNMKWATPIWRSPLPFLGGLLVLYVSVPLIAFIGRLIDSGHSAWTAPGLGDALYVSVVTASISTAVIALVGIPLAYLLARSKGRFATFIGTVVYLPLALPPLMSGILLVYLFGPYTTLGRLFGGHLTETFVGIVLAQTFVAAPFLVVAARSSIAAIDPTLFEKAATLGRKEFHRFSRVAIPVAWGGIRAGLLLAWLRAFGEYGATAILGYHPYSLSVYTYLQFGETGLTQTLAPTALALGIAAIVVCLSRIRPRVRAAKLHPLLGVVATSPRSRPPVLVGFNVKKSLGAFHLDTAYTAKSKTIAILGASGAGKSCILRCIAGLFGSDSGSITFSGTEVSNVAVEERNVGYVPQGLALFPHLTVARQLLFGVDADPALAQYWVDRLHIAGLEDRFPHELSGGERQRVCLAQVLCREPALVLLDEPFSALDAPVRSELRHEFRRLQKETGLSTVLVTHDPEEAAMLADDIVVIADGKCLQAGSREEVFGAPKSAAVARLLGIANIHSGIVRSRGAFETASIVIEADTGELANGTPIFWCIRPERISLSKTGGLQALVTDVIELGGVTEFALSLRPGFDLQARTASGRSARQGEEVQLQLERDAINVWSQ